ncbi:MAG: hypothetical protein HQL56_04545 [Magnetococcales bacterium]|nr:hypothetical protein [Magnetococcales bacterium]
MMSETANRRRHERVFCGLPMEFDGCVGNALDVNEIAVFLILASPCAVTEGQNGVLKFVLEGKLVEERATVARITKAGISLASLEEVSIFPKLMESSRSGVKFVEHTKMETSAHFRGEFGASFWDDFLRIYDGRGPARRYRLNFANVATISPSGLAMLLHLVDYNQGGKDDIQISHCNKEVLKTISQLLAPGIAISLSADDASNDETHKFGVSVAYGARGEEIVTIRIARMFDYNCRLEFAKIYRNRPKNTEYILDFQDTLHLGKAAFGTMLLLNQHNREHQGRPVRIINCSPFIRSSLDSMKFGRFFEFTS